MRNELSFILFLMLPWAVATAAYVFYRRRNRGRGGLTSGGTGTAVTGSATTEG